MRRGCGPAIAAEAAALVLANAEAAAARRALAAFNIAAAAAAILTTNQPSSTHLSTYGPGIWIGGFVPTQYIEEV